MSTNNHINRTLITIPRQPISSAKMLLSGPQIKTEYKSGVSKDKNSNSLPSRMKSEFCDISIKSEYSNNSSNFSIDSSRKSHEISPRSMEAHVKQEILRENIKTEPVEIKCEYNDYNSHEYSTKKPIKIECNEYNSHASSTEKPYSIKTEVKYGQQSIEQFKMPEKKFKMEPNDLNMVYRCCHKRFFDKFQHFQHMLCHTEKKSKRRRKLKPIKCIQCYYCHRFFQKESDMIRHAKSVHTGFSCIYCQLNFPMKELLLQHLAFTHNVTLKSNESYSQPSHFKWQRQGMSQSADNKCIKKIKEECTSNIKMEPVKEDVKMGFNPNIKTES